MAAIAAVIITPLAALVLHESAHALAAWLCGVKLWGISLGYGPVARTGRTLGINWQAHRKPIGVGVALLNGQHIEPWQAALIAAAPLLLGLALLPLPFGALFTVFNAINLVPRLGVDGQRLFAALAQL